MTNKQKAKKIVDNIFSIGLNANNTFYDMAYNSALEMAEWKDSQPQIVEIFGKRVKIVEEKEIHYTCKHCCFDMECRKIKGLFKDSMICKDSNKKVNRYFVYVDENGNESSATMLR